MRFVALLFLYERRFPSQCCSLNLHALTAEVIVQCVPEVGFWKATSRYECGCPGLIQNVIHDGIEILCQHLVR